MMCTIVKQLKAHLGLGHRGLVEYDPLIDGQKFRASGVSPHIHESLAGSGGEVRDLRSLVVDEHLRGTNPVGLPRRSVIHTPYRLCARAENAFPGSRALRLGMNR